MGNRGGLPWVVGAALSHNGAVCLMHGDEIVVAIQEERLTRSKRAWITDLRRSNALAYCLDTAGISIGDVDIVVQATLGEGDRVVEALDLGPEFRGESRLLPHHLAHAYGTFATSGFGDAVVLTIDGGGSTRKHLGREFPDELTNAIRISPTPDPRREREILGVYHAVGTEIRCLEKHLGTPGPNLVDGVSHPGSLGGLFTAAGSRIFHEGLNGAGKVMGLAPLGEPTIPVEQLVELDGEGRMTFPREVFEAYSRFEEPWPAHQKEYADLAGSVQRALEVALGEIWIRCADLGLSENIVYAGGVALNSVANQMLVAGGRFRRHYIMPAAEDSGTAIGAAYHGLWSWTGENTAVRMVRDSLGRRYRDDEVEMASQSVRFMQLSRHEDSQGAAADALAAGRIVGWFEGGSELGPRALGHRSILCDPRRSDGKEVLNARVKHRESFRPFAPVILAEEVPKWCAVEGEDMESPFMLRVFDFREDVRSLVPAVVHVDGTGRVQTVTASDNPALHGLVSKFRDVTGVPIVLNTSFNVMGEPIVESPEDALWCLAFSGMDEVYFENFVVGKDPDFPGVLDLPFHSVGLDSLEERRDGRGNPFYLVHGQGRWGPRLSVIRRPDEIGIAAGSISPTTGRELMAASMNQREPLSELRTIRAMASLHRSGVIRFE